MEELNNILWNIWYGLVVLTITGIGSLIYLVR